MRSKTLINILALVALAGLTAFVVVTLMNSNDQIVNSRTNIDTEKNLFDKKNVAEEITVLENNLIDLRAKKAFLEGGISENEKSSNELGEIILLLRQQRKLLVSDVAALDDKKVELGMILSNIRGNISDEKSNDEMMKNEMMKNRRLTYRCESMLTI